MASNWSAAAASAAGSSSSAKSSAGASSAGSSTVGASAGASGSAARSTTLPSGATILVSSRMLSAPLPASSADSARSEEHTSELQSLMRISYAVFCLQKKKQHNNSQ